MRMVRVVQRALAILECFDAERSSLSLHEISRRIDLPKSTTFRILATLTESGYLVHKSNQEYCLSAKLMHLASVAQQSFDIRDVARPTMTRLVVDSGETVEVSMLSGLERVCLDVVESPSPLKSIIRPGARLSLLFGATGKIFMADMDARAIAKIVRTDPRGGEIDRATLTATLRQVRERGFAISRSERVVGATAIAVPLRDETGTALYCLTMTGPTVRFADREAALCQMMCAAGRAISTRLGHVAATEDRVHAAG